MYKGPMDKAKGGSVRVGSGGGEGRGLWWGENGDNWTWTTIQKNYRNKKIKKRSYVSKVNEMGWKSHVRDFIVKEIFLM